MSSRKHWKLQEFVAHAANVNCLSFGRKSGRVLVTGGDDKKVNLWAVGKPNCIMSHKGHSTPVDCVCFDPREVMVCAGSLSGALKVFDLEASKIVRTLTGHKSSIRCSDFHPYGDYIVSGSLDTNIRLWDARKQGCIYTYTGHNKAVNTVKFSPDGKWVASGAEDGSVKLWDLSAGKLLTEFSGHTAAVSGVEFHPNEFLLASGSADRTVKFWDLESFQLVSTTGGDGPPVRCVYFHSSGLCMFSGAQDSLRVYGWEPSLTYDSLLTGWGKVYDMAMTQNQLVAGSFSMNTVTVYMVQLDSLKPLAKMDNSNISYIPNQYPITGNHARKSFDRDAGNQKLNSFDMKVVESISQEFDVENDNFSLDELKAIKSDEVFIPKSELCRTPPKSDPFPMPLDANDLLKEDYVFKSIERETKSLSIQTSYNVTAEIPEKLSKSPVSSPIRIASPVKNNFVASSPVSSGITIRSNQFSSSVTNPSFSSKPTFLNDKNSQGIRKPCEKATAIRWSGYPPEAVSIVRPTTILPDRDAYNHRTAMYPDHMAKTVSKTPDSYVPEQRDQPAGLNVDDFLPCIWNPRILDSYVPEQSTDSGTDSNVPEQRDQPAGLNVDDFLPVSQQKCLGTSQAVQPEVSEAEAMNLICREHQAFLMVFDNRLKKLQIILAVMKSKGPKIATDTAVSMNEPAVLVDFLSVLNRRQDLWSLDLCQSLLPFIQDLVQSKFESYMSIGCSSVKLILQKFGNLIKTNIDAPPRIGVDLCGEERVTKCKNCYEQLLGIQSFILKRQTMQGKLGQSFRELLAMLCTEFNRI